MFLHRLLCQINFSLTTRIFFLHRLLCQVSLSLRFRSLYEKLQSHSTSSSSSDVDITVDILG